MSHKLMNHKPRFHHILLLCISLLLGFLAFRLTYLDAFRTSRTQSVIVIDVGHGGYDPGKVAVDNTLEKDINLEIARKLRTYLEAQDCIVYMTREEDVSLCDEADRNKKQSDMQNRVALIENVQPDLMISIHQNSYPSEEVHGAQTFYYHTSDNSEYLASCVQNCLISYADPDNTRQHKSNSSYYILKNVSCPAIIVECGFLSNRTECALLDSDTYQDKIAYSIAMGIRTYLNTSK